MPAQTAIIARNDIIATATKELVIRTNTPFTFIPGQYITILVPTPDGKKLGRSYSIASQKTTDNAITLVVKIVTGGLGSTYIDKLQPGDQIEFLGPLGRFALNFPLAKGESSVPSGTEQETSPLRRGTDLPQAKQGDVPMKYLFVATGTGIAPFIPMINSLLHKQSDINHQSSIINHQSITCLLGFRHAEDIFYADLLKSWAMEHANLHFICTLSQPDENWTEGQGRVTNYLREHPELLTDVQTYICGNGSMINEVAQIAQDHGNPKEQIFFEKYNNL